VRVRRSLAAALLFFAACDLGVRYEPDCRGDTECSADAICIIGACVRVPQTTVALALAFTPPNDSGYPKQQVGRVEAAPEGGVPDQVLKTAVLFGGRVLMEGSEDVLGMRARVEAVRPGEVPGTFLRASAATVPDPQTGRRTFRLLLVPGRYEITVYPDSPDLPTYRLRSPIDLTTSSESNDLVLPPVRSLRTVSGIVLETPDEPEPVVDAHVQVFDSAGVAVSTLGRTDVLGRFTVALPPGEMAHLLRISPSPENPHLPVLERTPVSPGAIVEVGPIYVGKFEGPVPVQCVLKGKAADGRDVPVAGATVLLTGSVGNGTWSEQLVSGPGGDLVVDLPFAQYKVEIRPTAESEHALYFGVLTVTGPKRVEWALARKARLWGRVTDDKGVPVTGLTVQAVRRGPLAADGDGLRYIKGVDTDAYGQYGMLLDTGIYDLAFMPAGRPLARGELSSFAMSAADVRHDQRLPVGVAVTGVLRDMTGRPFPGVGVEVYALGTIAKLVGAGLTDAAGRYRVVLPETAVPPR
jgi:hypothetical protein